MKDYSVTVQTNTFKVCSSQGDIRVDVSTGDVLDMTIDEDSTDEYFPQIKRFDLAERKIHRGEDIPKGDNIDILDLGYWYGKGNDENTWEYEEPAHDWRKLIAEL